MKLKMIISGPKVHDIGYRVFLLKNAMNTALPGLFAYNWEEGERQQVVALAEGERDRMEAFLNAIQTNKPVLAEVSGVTSEPSEGEVARTSEVAMLCSFVKLDKATQDGCQDRIEEIWPRSRLGWDNESCAQYLSSSSP